MAAERMSGTVKWFSRVKGYGFIAPDGEEREIFVHFTGIEGEGYRNLEKGEKVSFVVEDTDKGPQAVNVRAEGFDVTSWTAEPTDEDETSWRAEEKEAGGSDDHEPEEEATEDFGPEQEISDEPSDEPGEDPEDFESEEEISDEPSDETVGEAEDVGSEKSADEPPDEPGEEAEDSDSAEESTEELETEPPDLVA